MSKSFIQLTQLSKSFGSSILFDRISFSINKGDAFALIGENGSGKTTLLELLVGNILPDSGDVSRSLGLTIGYLPQEIRLENPHISVREYLEEGPLNQLEYLMKACLEKGDIDGWEELHEKYAQLGGYKRVPVEKAFAGLKLELSFLDSLMSELSSGQKVRVALAKALCKSPDLLLLDEPTNHLDTEMLEWLRATWPTWGGAVVIVSHDRKFLNRTCNHLIEIKKGELRCYGGSYDFYLEEQKRILEMETRAYEEQQAEKSSIKQQLKAMTFSKKKGSLPSDRNFMGYDKRGEKFQKSQQHQIGQLKARLGEIEANRMLHPNPKTIKGLHFLNSPLASSVVVEIEQVSKSFGGKLLFSDLQKTIRKGERVVLVGPNGSGKTTLLKIIAGLLEADVGAVKCAPSARVGYLDQEVESLLMEQTPLEYFSERFAFSEEDLRRELHKAALGGEELLRRPLCALSVGQRKRLALLTLVLEKPNVLLLDEPTNHLDFLTMEAFESALLDFQGAILAVSHDSTFIEKIATEQWDLLTQG